MGTIYLHVEQRRAWVRRHKRIVIYERDRNYARFAKDPSGTIKLMLRIWLVEHGSDQKFIRAYLGTITFCFVGPSGQDIIRLFRFTSKAARESGASAKELRHDLSVLLRKHIHEEYGA